MASPDPKGGMCENIRPTKHWYPENIKNPCEAIRKIQHPRHQNRQDTRKGVLMERTYEKPKTNNEPLSEKFTIKLLQDTSSLSRSWQ